MSTHRQGCESLTLQQPLPASHPVWVPASWAEMLGLRRSPKPVGDSQKMAMSSYFLLGGRFQLQYFWGTLVKPSVTILFFHTLGLIIPTDEFIFFRGVAHPPTRHCYLIVVSSSSPQFFDAQTWWVLRWSVWSSQRGHLLRQFGSSFCTWSGASMGFLCKPAMTGNGF